MSRNHIAWWYDDADVSVDDDGGYHVRSKGDDVLLVDLRIAVNQSGNWDAMVETLCDRLETLAVLAAAKRRI